MSNPPWGKILWSQGEMVTTQRHLLDMLMRKFSEVRFVVKGHYCHNHRISQIEAALNAIFKQMGLDSSPLDGFEYSAPVLVQDLLENTEELSELCEVLSQRSLSVAQLESLKALELTVMTLEKKAQDFASAIRE